MTFKLPFFKIFAVTRLANRRQIHSLDYTQVKDHLVASLEMSIAN